jgi:hypothetical protein
MVYLTSTGVAASTANIFLTTSNNVGIGTTAVDVGCQLKLFNSTYGGQLGLCNGQQTDTSAYLRLGMDSGWTGYIALNGYWNGSSFQAVNGPAYGGFQAARMSFGSASSAFMTFDTASGPSTTTTFSYTERMRIANSGNVGIGITAPQSNLHVNAAVGGNGLTIGPTAPYVTSGFMFALSILNDGLTIGQGTVIQIGKSAFNSMFISYIVTSTPDTDYVSFAGYGKAAGLYLRNDGKVGVGTSTPAAQFTVYLAGGGSRVAAIGSADVYMTLGQDGAGGTNGSVIQCYAGGNSSTIGTSAYRLLLQPYGSSVVIGGTADNGNRLQVNGVSNFTSSVGIAIASPGCALDVNGTIRCYNNFNGAPYYIVSENAANAAGAYAIYYLTAGGSSCIWFKNSPSRTDDGGANTATIRNDAGKLRLMANSGAGININGANVGINVVTPLKTLDVLRPGGAFADAAIMIRNNGNGTGMRIQTYDLAADGNAYMGLGTDMGGNAYEHSLYFPYGSVGQGIQTVGWYNGTNYSTRAYIQTNSTNWLSISDIRAKDIVRPISNVLPLLSKLSTIVYTLKADEIKTNHLGLIAQEVALVYPEACDIPVDPEKMMGINYTELVPVLVEAAKELAAENTILKARLDSLESRLAAAGI